MRQFFTHDGQMVHEIGRFDRAKRLLDDRIDVLRRAGEREMAAILTRLKNDLLAAVDAIPTNNLGARYAEARSRFSSRMEARDAYTAGRAVWREGSEEGVESYQQIVGEGNQKLFRLGLLAGYHDLAERPLTGADRLALFSTPRMEAILAHVIPHIETATGRARIRGGEPAVFADAPQRFGTWRENEARMIATRTKAIGGSPTAERLNDDQAFRALSTITEIFHSARNRLKVQEDIARQENTLRGLRRDQMVREAEGRLSWWQRSVRDYPTLTGVATGIGAAGSLRLMSTLWANWSRARRIAEANAWIGRGTVEQRIGNLNRFFTEGALTLDAYALRSAGNRA
jgi:hypothetical protein